MDTLKVLIIDDEADIRNLLGRIIKLEGFDVDLAEDAAKGYSMLKKSSYHVILCDVRLPDGYGVDMVPLIKKEYPNTEIVLLTAYGKIEDGVSAIKNGAFDYITKGDENSKIIPIIHKAAERAALRFKSSSKKGTGIKDGFEFGQIIGQSKTLQSAISLAKRVAKTNTTVLLNGETGTGKEVFAQAIHNGSKRFGKPFVAINCSAFGKDLLESEMFGHKVGAFTGAVQDKKGLFEVADGGTIFLDELGEMDLHLQAKLLRVLESGTFIKVGDTKECKVDVRIITATNRDLEAEAEAGNFRLDLYYRLSVFKIKLPALSDRPEDIPILASYFLSLTLNNMELEPLEMGDEFLFALQKHKWKGNVRELRNVVERAVILCEGSVLKKDCLPFDFGLEDNISPEDRFKLRSLEQSHIVKVLQHTGGNKTKTAELLGIGLTTLYRKMVDYGIEK